MVDASSKYDVANVPLPANVIMSSLLLSPVPAEKYFGNVMKTIHLLGSMNIDVSMACLYRVGSRWYSEGLDRWVSTIVAYGYGNDDRGPIELNEDGTGICREIVDRCKKKKEYKLQLEALEYVLSNHEFFFRKFAPDLLLSKSKI